MYAYFNLQSTWEDELEVVLILKTMLQLVIFVWWKQCVDKWLCFIIVLHDNKSRLGGDEESQ